MKRTRLDEVVSPATILRFTGKLWPAMQWVTANKEKYPLTVAATLFIIRRKAYFPHLFTSYVSLSQFDLYFSLPPFFSPLSLSLSIYLSIYLSPISFWLWILSKISVIENSIGVLCNKKQKFVIINGTLKKIMVNWKKYSNTIHSDSVPDVVSHIF